jgi:hypothetical protein
MSPRVARCVVVEVAETRPGVPESVAGAKDVLPWADPYIATLLASRRLRTALDDSLRFIEQEQEGDWRLPEGEDRITNGDWRLPCGE